MSDSAPAKLSELEIELGVTESASIDLPQNTSAKKTTVPTPPQDVSLKDKVWRMIMKQTDQLSPVHVRTMGFSWQAFIVAFMAASFLVAFFYVVFSNTRDRCTEGNGCLTCATSVVDKAGQICAPQAVSSLSIISGCLGFSPDNNFTLIDQTMRYDAKSLVLSSNQYVDGSVEEKTNVDRFMRSLDAHTEIWECFSQNKFGQVQDPDSACVLAWAQTHWAGLSDSTSQGERRLASGKRKRRQRSHGRALQSEDEALRAEAANLRVYALKLMSSLFSIKSVLSSVFQDEGDARIKVLQKPNEDEDEDAERRLADERGTNYGYVAVEACACSIASPAGDVGATDPFLANYATDETQYANSLGTVQLMLPVNYIQFSNDTHDNGHMEDGPAVMEWLPGNTIENMGNPRHCSANVFTGGGSTLLSGTFECCAAKPPTAIISEANAFGTFAVTVNILLISILILTLDPEHQHEGHVSARSLTKQLSKVIGGVALDEAKKAVDDA
jgi:hypothetical protein